MGKIMLDPSGAIAEDDLDLGFALDLGLDIAFDPGLEVQFGVSLGGRDALAIGASFREF